MSEEEPLVYVYHKNCRFRLLNSTCPNNEISKCQFIEYDTSLWTNNLVMYLDLVCDRTWMKALPNYGWFFGMFLTSFTLQFPDFFGRWKMLIVSQLGLTVTTFLTAISRSVYFYSQVDNLASVISCW